MFLSFICAFVDKAKSPEKKENRKKDNVQNFLIRILDIVSTDTNYNAKLREGL